MPSVEGRFTDRRILLSLAVAPTNPTGAMPSFPIFEPCLGVLDTGAMTTAISNRLVQKLALRPIGRKPVVSAAGTNMHNLHTFRLGSS
jgi:predicted aspartyl protease